MTRPTSHWHNTTSVPGPVDPDGCCADQPEWTPPTVGEFAARQRAQQDAEADARLAKGLRGERS